MRSKRWKKIFTFAPVYVFLLGLVFFSVFPSLWMFLTSIKPPNEVFTTPPRYWAENPTLDNYNRVLFESRIPRAFLNSTLVSAATGLITLLLALPAGYGFARYRFTGAGLLSTSLLFGQMLPAVVLVIPLYIVLNKLDLIDTHAGLIIANLSVTIPVAVMMMRSYIESVPRELEEAAKIDGVGNIGVLVRIVMPVSIPGIVAVSIFTVIHAWEEFLYALNFANSAAVKTLPITLAEFSGQFKIDWGGMMSAAVVISLPVLLLFLICNKYFVKGLSDGAVKG
jgi:ABC-type sugar transport system, permease component